MQDTGYTTIFEQNKANIYAAMTTTNQANNQPILEALRCASTGLWKLQLDPSDQPEALAINNLLPEETLYAIFNLPSAQQTLLWYHAAVGFPTKETFIDTVHARNYAMWPGLTVQMINRHFPDSTETVKGHLKGKSKAYDQQNRRH
jgi:hypothetical protein